MADMKAVKAGKQNSSSTDDAYETGIGTQFSVETNTRDEDAEMCVNIIHLQLLQFSYKMFILFRMKYIEEQLAKRKGLMQEDEDKSNKYLTPEEIAFSSVPEYLRVKSSVQSEEMLSNQMLSGIPEVDLGIEYANLKNFDIKNFYNDFHNYFIKGPKLRILKQLKKQNRSCFKKDFVKKMVLQCLFRLTWPLILSSITDVPLYY
jgi:hypothetical protein